MPKKYRQFTINFQPRFLWTELMSHAWLLFQKRSCRNLMTKDFPFKNSSYCVRLSSLHAERKDGQFLWFAGRRTNTKIKRFQKKKQHKQAQKHHIHWSYILISCQSDSFMPMAANHAQKLHLSSSPLEILRKESVAAKLKATVNSGFETKLSWQLARIFRMVQNDKE